MSNNKQSSVEFLFEQTQTNGIVMFNELGEKTKLFRLMNEEVFEQAKAMHENEIMEAYKKGNHSEMRGGKVICEKMKQYYNETFNNNE